MVGGTAKSHQEQFSSIFVGVNVLCLVSRIRILAPFGPGSVPSPPVKVATFPAKHGSSRKLLVLVNCRKEAISALCILVVGK